MNFSTITAASRKALMVADPQYHAWPAEQQERFRASMDEAARKRIKAVLLREIKDIDCTVENVEERWDELPIAELNDLNWALLLTHGVGEDWVFLNESMAENTSLLDFQTLYDYDFNDHLFQERANKSEFSNYQPRDYYALRFMRWVRLLIDERLCYANLFSLADYINSDIEEKGTELIGVLIPHDYQPGKQHGTENKKGYIRWDMQIDAGGQEKQLEELKRRWFEYL